MEAQRQCRAAESPPCRGRSAKKGLTAGIRKGRAAAGGAKNGCIRVSIKKQHMGK